MVDKVTPKEEKSLKSRQKEFYTHTHTPTVRSPTKNAKLRALAHM